MLTTYPLLWMTLTAFRSEGDALQRPLGLPARWVLSNLQEVLRSGRFAQAYINSLLVCVVAVFLAISCATLAAYAFARFNFRGKNFLYVLFLMGLMIPVHVTLIPLNQLLGADMLGLKGSLSALIGPYAGFALPVSILILRRAFEALPGELLDAATLDGCSNLQVLWHVGLPLAKPALNTVLIFNFLTMWNEYAFALTLLGASRQTVPLAISEFKGEYDLRITVVCAALLLVMIPLIVVYAFAQKQIIRGLTAGALD
ncbi:MAG: carbohydrate ABC transporter permease [Oligosphaeraceae bacterium]|nr:carbohydrate ABC transporter permease [Oligosphaeraceae bacterium]